MIEIHNLTKRYGPVTAVDDITFTARPGHVTGFLGPNGAGKSTAMRMMCGLTPPTSGSARIMGRPYRALPNPTRHVGVMLDAAAQHAGRTGREVLTLGAILAGAGQRDVKVALDRVGLSQREADRRVGAYSLGMRQRLGLAAALIGDPGVLILDEPANGLDPAGIRWMRGLLREYARQGGTVLLSSHLLSEVEQIADDLILIGRGRIVAQGTTDELLSAGGVVVDATDREALHAALLRAGYEPLAHPAGGFTAQASATQIGHLALTEGLVITSLNASGGGLEEMFLTLTADDAREVAA